MQQYDLIIIGAGPAGYAAAMRAVDYKKKTLLIEKKRIGGAGIENGALSSKTWWELARETRVMNKTFENYHIARPEISFSELKTHVHNAITERRSLLEEHITLLEQSKCKGLLTLKIGHASLLNENEVEIVNDGLETVYGKYIILATGSRPRYLHGIPIDEKIIMTSDGIEQMQNFPESMVILGAGVIGCEFATIFSGFGRTKVHLIDKGNRILPFEDDDIVKVIEDNMEADGVLIHRNSRLTKMEIVEGKVKYQLKYEDGREEVFYVEKALVSVGRIPNYDNLWNGNINIGLTPRGITDQETQTSVPNIFAVGDLTADIALVNVAELEGRYAVEKIFGDPERNLVYENISTIMFLNPEVAGVGLNENQAQEKGLDYKVVTLDYKCIARAIAERNTQGFIKLLVTNDDDMKILGMRVVGNHASNAIQAVALLISMDKGIEELAECVHPHPSVTEGIQECVRMLMGKSMLKPSAFEVRLSCRKYQDGKYHHLEF
ncbi:MAG: NAD(P)/FAD-dependent oxidoreductase [Cyclobacteriaceae bacterium]|nr:NAD(P)/FAD-dependent oxidoreductase [Cyclobacteriaceae bacterium]